MTYKEFEHVKIGQMVRFIDNPTNRREVEPNLVGRLAVVAEKTSNGCFWVKVPVCTYRVIGHHSRFEVISMWSKFLKPDWEL